jgi:hypothetical protein
MFSRRPGALRSVAIAAIVGITVLEVTALLVGVDGIVLAASTGTIGTIGGALVRR